MVFYTIISCVVLALLALMVGAVAWNILSQGRKERIRYVRQFKKGKGAMIYVVVIPLLIIGKLYDGARFLDAFFEAIPESLSLIVLKFSFDSVGGLMGALPVFAIAVYIAFFLIIVNALLLTFSLFQQQIWTMRQKLRWQKTKRERLLLIGYNQENLSIYASEKKRVGAIVGDIPKAEKERLYIGNVGFVSTKRPTELLEKALENALSEEERGAVVAIVNTFDDQTNVSICRKIIEKIEKCCTDERAFLRFFRRFRVFVYGDGKFEAIYTDIEDKSKGCITYINKYRQIATDFVDRYPFTRFMGEKQIDKDTFLVSPAIDINALMIGFGKTNRQLFLTSVANNQFLQKQNGEIVLKKVNYYVFDHANSRNEKNLNHSYYRFAEELKEADVNAYLPLPSEPANDEFYFRLDVNDPVFYASVREVVGKNPDDVNYIIVAYGDDLENLDMAQKLLEKKREWEVQNLVLFVKVRAALAKHTLFDKPDCYPFGVEKECVYDIERITNDRLSAMAKLRNRLYALEYRLSSGEKNIDAREVFETADLQWYTQKTQAERESNVYACLSLRSKLNLMGLDYKKITEAGEGLTEAEYLDIYAADDPLKYRQTADGRKAVEYTLDFPDSNRKTMAIQEHYRWNSYMISKGFVPATKERILTETTEKKGKTAFTNGKNYKLRTHGNLTTWDGLAEFRRILAERDGVNEAQTDVMKYDYQALDDAYRLLFEGGYKIVRKEMEI